MLPKSSSSSSSAPLSLPLLLLLLRRHDCPSPPPPPGPLCPAQPARPALPSTNAPHCTLPAYPRADHLTLHPHAADLPPFSSRRPCPLSLLPLYRAAASPHPFHVALHHLTLLLPALATRPHTSSRLPMTTTTPSSTHRGVDHRCCCIQSGHS